MNGKAQIKSISFNIEVNGIKYKDVVINYDKNDKLTLADIHYEDNNSWKLIKIGDDLYDFQIYGNDDSKATKKPDGILKTRLSIQLFKMYKHNNKWYHSSDILCSLDKSAKITYVRIDTNQGRKFANLL